MHSHSAIAASNWVERWAHHVPAGCRVLDVACGHGRHARLFAERGCQVTAVDRDPACQSALDHPNIRFVAADLEQNSWPLDDEQFDAILVTNYLHRPLFPTLLSALALNAWLIYETFALGNARFGKPSNPDFLLRPRELLDVFGHLRVVAFEDGCIAVPSPAMVQRIAACNADPHGELSAKRCRL